MIESSLIYWLFCYIIGNFMTAYVVGKMNHVDLRLENSRNLGARNAGRVLGRWAFIVTLLGDALKGGLVIGLGRSMGFEQWVLAGGLFFVIVGHLYPFWLKFHGGKGVATFIGAGLCLEPSLFLWMISGSILLLLIVRSLTVCMLGGFTLYIAGMVWEGSLMAHCGVVLSICLIIWKHRRNFWHIMGQQK
ncbi:glycerol-3-phosphate acyltransferase [Ureibacillus sinduriensis]|uniref:glycerol-3-phosphate acyltransferase n=1 Tax=Ureibacillus sinduriensis TaxID=561440 RepID=UPI00056D0DDF|nr:glycerol-3-phosphate acyltransferase [Ureibacillus sinduriensis]